MALVPCKSCGKELAKGVKKCVNCGADQRNFFGRHKIVTGFLVLVVLGVAINAVGGGTDSGSTSTVAGASEDAAVAAIPVTAVALAAAYESNEVKADQTYKDKTVSISGVVDSIGVIAGQTFVVLKAKDDFALTQTQCFFNDDAEIAKVAELKEGSKVTVTGVVDGKSLNVGVNDCTLQ